MTSTVESPPADEMPRSTVRNRSGVRGVLILIYAVAGVAVCIAAQRYYRGKVFGFGDDWNLLEPSTYTETRYIATWYLKWNGKIAEALPLVGMRGMTRVFHWRPTTFPWALPVAMAFLGTLLVPVNLLLTAFSRRRNAAPIALSIASVIGVWTLNPVVYGTTLQTAQTIAYALPLFAFSAAALLLVFAGRRAAIVAVAAVYIFVSLSSEQLLPAIAVLFAFISIIRALDGLITRRQLVFEIVLWALLTVVCTTVFLRAPGQVLRNPAAGAAMPTRSQFLSQFVKWYSSSTRAGWDLLFRGHSQFAATMYTLLLVTLIGVAVDSWQRHDRATVRLALLALGFLAAYSSSLAHLFVSPYFPERARMIPSSLLAVGLAVALTVFAGYAGRAAVVHVLVFVVLVWIIALPNVEASLNEYRSVTALAEVRRAVYAQVEADLQRGSASKFRLTRCPLELDKSWGYEGYLKWIGRPDVRIVQDGNNGDMDPFAPSAGNWIAIPCTVDPLFPVVWNGPLVEESEFPSTTEFTPPLVRAICESGKDRRIYDFDYALPKSAIRCEARVAFNSAGGGPYQQTLDLVTMFGTTQNDAHDKTVRRMRTDATAGFRTDKTVVAVGWAAGTNLGGEVPIDAFDARPADQPLFRVRFDIPSAGWPNGDPIVRCQ